MHIVPWYEWFVWLGNEWYWAMSEIKVLKNVDNFDVNSSSKNNPIGYILEVDLEYADELQVLHNDYPLTCNCSWHVVRLFSRNCQQMWGKS